MAEKAIPAEPGMVKVREQRKVEQFDRTLDFGGRKITADMLDGYFDARRLADAAQDKRMYITIYPDGSGMRITYQNFSEDDAKAIEAEVLALAK